MKFVGVNHKLVTINRIYRVVKFIGPMKFVGVNHKLVTIFRVNRVVKFIGSMKFAGVIINFVINYLCVTFRVENATMYFLSYFLNKGLILCEWKMVKFLCHFFMCLPLNCQLQQLSSALSSACDFKSHFCKQCGPRLDCSSRSRLIWVHTVCLYAKIGLKSLQEYLADDINRRHFQMQVFLAF